MPDYGENLGTLGIDPSRRQAIMQRGIGTLKPQLKDTAYNVGRRGNDYIDSLIPDEGIRVPRIFEKGFRTSRDPSTWPNSPYFRDFLTAFTRDHGDLETQEYLANEMPWGDWYKQHAGQNVPPWMGPIPRVSRYNNTIGFDVNFSDPFGLGGDLSFGYDYGLDDENYKAKFKYGWGW